MQNKSDLGSVYSGSLGLCVLGFMFGVFCCGFHFVVQIYQLQMYIINLSCRSNWSWWNYQELLIRTS